MPQSNIIPTNGISPESCEVCSKVRKMLGNSHVQLGVDSALTAGAVFLPVWVYEISAWAGFFATIFGLLLIISRLILAFRDLRRPPKNQAEQDFF